MANKKQRIEEFLYYFRDIAIQNPGLKFSHDSVYHELTGLGIPENEKRVNINQHFGYWQDYFAYDRNCRSFVAPNWTYFCQFVSSDGVAKRAEEHLKVYIPLDSAHIKRGAIEIFNFLSSQGISHLSKIGSHVRFDDIVVRLVNPEDLKKLMNFLKNNKYIQEGLLPANPFVFNLDGIPMAVDGCLSFNSTIASLIQFYINNKVDTKTLNTVGVDDFYKYVEDYYNYAFSSAQGLQRLCADFRIRSSNYSEMVNYKNVFELILKARNVDFSLEDYISHYHECSNPLIQRQKLRQMDDLQNRHEMSVAAISQPATYSDEMVNRTNNMLLKMVDIMMEKNPNQYEVLDTIYNYLMNGRQNLITRHKNLRYMVIDSSFREDLMLILKTKKISFLDYVQQFLANRKQQTTQVGNNSKDSYKTNEKFVILSIREYFSIMDAKYGHKTALDNLKDFLNDGSPTMITRDNDLRFKLVNSTFRMDLINILRERNISLSDYIRAISGVTIEPKEVYLEQAIMETYTKYEELFQNGSSEYSGIDFVTSAIIQLGSRGIYSGFTRNNNARENLMTHVTPADLLKIMSKDSGFDYDPNRRFTRQEITLLSEQYVARILENNLHKSL